VRQDMAKRRLADLAPAFVQATGRQAALLYKEEIEVLLRTPNHAGFSLLDLHDYPGQGTALVGPLDPFWDSKGFITPAQHRRYCGPTTPLARMKKRTFTTAESFAADIEIAHFGPKDLAHIEPTWSIADARGRRIASGSLAVQNVPTGKLSPLGSLRTSLAKTEAPGKLTVTVAIEGTPFANDWEIWVYPAALDMAVPVNIIVATQWPAAKSALTDGKRVLLFPAAADLAETLPGSFLPVFWSAIWFPRQLPNTSGVLCDPKHPALAEFPTEFYSNWQWYELLNRSRSFVLDGTSPEFRPIVQVIDNFARNHKLGNLFEARVGRGRLLVCGIDLPALADRQPAARQLLKSLYDYVASDAFDPPRELGGEVLDRLLAIPLKGGSP
jgi:hypothetical protein